MALKKDCAAEHSGVSTCVACELEIESLSGPGLIVNWLQGLVVLVVLAHDISAYQR